jgi:hypothetical protein
MNMYPANLNTRFTTYRTGGLREKYRQLVFNSEKMIQEKK